MRIHIIVLKEKGLFNEAMEYFLKAIQLDPGSEDAYSNLGLVFKEKGQIDEAIKYYQKALAISPDNAEIHFGVSLALLESGNFQEGWKEYERRWGTKDFIPYLRKFSNPVWDGSALTGKSIFIFTEQGVGDEIMFASCIPEIIEQSGLCILECDKRLVPLFARSFPKAEVMERIEEGIQYPFDLQHADMKIAVGSLPKYFRTSLATFPQQKSYLIPDTQKVEMWRRRYQELGDGLKIGLSWRGGSTPSVLRKRSIILEQCEGLFSIYGVHFINLQYGDCSGELRVVRERFNKIIYAWKDADPLRDLDNFAAQTAALDMVISVDNAAVHMAGALGVSVWTLLSFAPEWRWMLNREDSPWYPTMRLFRQPSPGDLDVCDSKSQR